MSLVLPHHLTCKEIVELVTQYAEGDLDDADRGRFEEHLATCGACVTYYDQMRQTVVAVGSIDHDHDHGRDAAIDPIVERSLMSAFRARLGGGEE
jgi:anti-sigma factor RsiW